MSDPSSMFLRRRDFDVTRELIVASLVFFHTARIFDQLDFYVKNTPQAPAMTFVVILTAFWGMPLLFTIAGFAIWHSLQKRTAIEFVRERFQRLLIPFITGLLVIVPPQIYYRLRVDPAYQETYSQFYPRFFDMTLKMNLPWFFSASPESGLFSPAHLWFLYILLVFTLLLLPVFLYLRKPPGRQLVGRAASFVKLPWAIFLPALPIAVIEAALGTDISGGWNQAVYIVFLCYGYLLAADVRFGQLLCKYRKIGLILAVVGSIGGIAVFAAIAETTHTDPLHAYDLASITLRFFKGIVGWCWMVAILGFLEDYEKKRKLVGNTRESRAPFRNRSFWASVERYANEAVLPFYLLHQTVIVVIGFYVVQWHTNALLKFLIISFTALTITLLLYEIVIKRTRLTRFCFGMK